MGLLLAATGGGAVFWVGWSVYNRVLGKKLIGGLGWATAFEPRCLIVTLQRY